MKISILVPLYGVERYVEQCARSLFEQSFESVEFIFVDDASPDNSAAIVERIAAEYPHQMERTTILRNERNMGVSATRNRAVECATGHFVLFVDGDDYCHQDLVEELAIEQLDLNYDIVWSNFLVDEEGAQTLVKAPIIGSKRGTLKVVASQSFAHPNRIWGMLIRRDLLLKNSIRFDERISMGEDMLLLAQILYHAKRVASIKDGLYHYRAQVGIMANLDQDNAKSKASQRSYIRATILAKEFLKSRSDSSTYSAAIWLMQRNLRKWILLRSNKKKTLSTLLFRGYCAALNSIYHLYCTIFER